MTGANVAGFNYDMWGDDNNALELDGIDDYAVINSGKLFSEGDFTVSFLMMPRSNQGRVFQKANFNNGLGASLGFGFDADLNSQGLHFYVSNNNNVCNAVTNASDASILPINKSMYQHAWYMVVIQYVKGVEKVYINGNLVSTQTTPNQTFRNCNTSPFYLGMWWLQDRRHFARKIDELRIYSRGLNDKEVRYLYDRLP